jgi:transcriptional regulator with XRE-family HTH domain
MSIPARQRVSPQIRGRELAREGTQLWQELGSVKRVAAELQNRHRDIPSLQAYRYAAGLSQDQAAARYNEVAEHQTTLGGTTINAWESWARGRGGGSPPPFSSLLILATAYGRGPLGVAEEDISPGDLVSEAYERLAPEDQLSLKRFTGTRNAPQRTEATQPHSQNVFVPQRPPADNVIGPDFNLAVPTVDNGNPEICVFSLPSPRPGQLLDLAWLTFGFGVELLIRQIKNLGRRLDVDICFGVNEAGLVMATFLSSAQFGRCAIGYLKCNKIRDDIALNKDSYYPASVEAPTIMVCDFEVKHADVVGFVARELRGRYPGAELYFAVFGAMTKGSDLAVDSFDDLTGARIMKAAGFAAVFIAATMSPPGIEPPLNSGSDPEVACDEARDCPSGPGTARRRRGQVGDD